MRTPSAQRPNPSGLAVVAAASILPVVAAVFLLLNISDVGWAAAGGLVALFAAGIGTAWVPGLQLSGGDGHGLHVGWWEIPTVLLLFALERLGRHHHAFAVMFACTFAIVVGWLAAAMIRHGLKRRRLADSGANGDGSVALNR